MPDTSIGTAATLRPPFMPTPSGSGMQVAELVRKYVDSYNSNDVEAMLDCCNDDVVFETITNPGGSIRLNGKDEVREVLPAGVSSATTATGAHARSRHCASEVRAGVTTLPTTSQTAATF